MLRIEPRAHQNSPYCTRATPSSHRGNVQSESSRYSTHSFCHARAECAVNCAHNSLRTQFTAHTLLGAHTSLRAQSHAHTNSARAIHCVPAHEARVPESIAPPLRTAASPIRPAGRPLTVTLDIECTSVQLLSLERICATRMENTVRLVRDRVAAGPRVSESAGAKVLNDRCAPP